MHDITRESIVNALRDEGIDDDPERAPDAVTPSRRAESHDYLSW